MVFGDVDYKLFAILQKYDFSSKSQQCATRCLNRRSCLRYCKSTIFQANHNCLTSSSKIIWLFAILQKYDFSSKSQPSAGWPRLDSSCLRYCKSTIFQANHNKQSGNFFFHLLFAILQKYDFSSKSQLDIQNYPYPIVVCDTAKVRFFKQITTPSGKYAALFTLFAILQKYDFSSKSQPVCLMRLLPAVVCDTAKVRFFKQITTICAFS